MKHLLILCAALGAFAQSFGTYSNPTNGAPVAHTSWLRSGHIGGNALGDPSLIVYYPIGMPSDKAYDYSGNGNTGTFQGTAAGGSGGKSSYPYFVGCPTYCPQIGPYSPYFFKSNANAINVPSFTLPTAFTVSAWVRPNTITISYTRIFETNYSTGVYLGTDATPSKFEFLVGSSSLAACAKATSTYSGNNTTWYLVTGTWSGTNAILYVNGVAQDTTCSSGMSAPSTPTATGRIGCAGTTCSSSGAWDGMIQDFRIYGRALTAAEILAIYNAETIPH